MVTPNLSLSPGPFSCSWAWPTLLTPPLWPLLANSYPRNSWSQNHLSSDSFVRMCFHRPTHQCFHTLFSDPCLICWAAYIIEKQLLILSCSTVKHNDMYFQGSRHWKSILTTLVPIWLSFYFLSPVWHLKCWTWFDISSTL